MAERGMLDEMESFLMNVLSMSCSCHFFFWREMTRLDFEKPLHALAAMIGDEDFIIIGRCVIIFSERT